MKKTIFNFTLIVAMLLSNAASAKANDFSIDNLVVTSLFTKHKEWACPILEQRVCASGTACAQQKSSVVIKLKLDEGSSVVYQRCDNKGCDTYHTHYSPSGLFTNIPLSGGALFKATNDGKSFVEIVTLGTTAYVNFGKCNPIQ